MADQVMFMNKRAPFVEKATQNKRMENFLRLQHNDHPY